MGHRLSSGLSRWLDDAVAGGEHPGLPERRLARVEQAHPRSPASVDREWGEAPPETPMSDTASGHVEYVRTVWPARPVHLPSIREQVRRWLDPLGLTGDTEQDFVLAASEAASNAVEHAYRPATAEDTVELTFWTEARAICIEIVDHGRWRAPAPVPGARGRGLMIMNGIIHTVLVHYDSRGTRVLLRHPTPVPLDQRRAT